MPVCHVRPNRRTVTAKREPVRSSTTGYCQEIRCPQLRHCPLRRRKLRTGILSYSLIAVRQLGHGERGITTLSPWGSRGMQTLPKPPTMSPNTKLTATPKGLFTACDPEDPRYLTSAMTSSRYRKRE